jgi:FkbM family methyltransferase
MRSAAIEYLRPRKWRHAARRRWFRARLQHAIPIAVRSGIEKLGSDYGGWLVPLAEVGKEWVVYSVGAGTDVTFDTELAKRCGCDVHVFDPTPAAVDHVRELANPKLHMHPWALWTADCDIDMYLPRAGSGSLSVVNLQQTAEHLRLPGRSLPSIMTELGHDRVDLLKVDIEGAEYEVLTPEMVLEAGVRILAIDLHPNVAPRRALAFIEAFLAVGFAATALEETDITLSRSR